MAVLLGLLVALSYGAGDFLGGLATRAQAVTTVVAASQATALAILVVVVLLEARSRRRVVEVELWVHDTIDLLGVRSPSSSRMTTARSASLR